MDQWQDILDLFASLRPDIKSMVKILQSAKDLLREDLAQFELERLLESLLNKPINLLDIIKSKRMDDAWCKPIGNSLKLLTYAVNKYREDMSSYYQPIVEVCNLTFEPGTKNQALMCLTCMAKSTALVAQEIPLHISAFAEDKICKTTLPLFIGSVCEHQPAEVEGEVTRIWRIYLSLLSSNENSDAVVTAILQGLLGLFKNFGQVLPPASLSDFYQKISKMYSKTNKCDSVILLILERHASLFRVSIAEDLELRNRLWDTLADAAGASALLSVYTAIFQAKEPNKEDIRSILRSEIIPRVRACPLTAYTALRVRAHSLRAHGVCEPIEQEPTVENLEFEMRCGNISEDVADIISWSMECGLSYSDKLLQTAIMFYRHVPPSKVKEVIVYRIGKVSTEARKTAVILLITESCQDSTSMDGYLPLWKLFFDSTDERVLEGAKLIFEDLMEYTRFQLKTALEDDLEVMPRKLSNLLKLTGKVAALLPPQCYTQAPSAAAWPLVERCVREWGASADAVACAAALVHHNNGPDYDEDSPEPNSREDTEDFFKMISIDGCRDESLLYECCLVMLQAHVPSRYEDISKIILSRNDVEPSTLSRSIRKLDAVMSSGLHETGGDGSRILDLVKKLRSKTMSGKDARILHRDISDFLAKYSDMHESARKSTSDALVGQPKGSLSLSLLNPDEGVHYKINLESVLQMAIRDQNTMVLKVLLTVTSAALANHKDVSLQRVVCLICRALCRAHVGSEAVDLTALHHALLQCEDIEVFTDLISYIKEEMSSGARRMLSDVLKSVMVLRTGSDFTEQLITTVGEQVLLMLDATDSLTRKAGLYLIESLAPVVMNNTGLMTLVPKMLFKICKIKHDNDVEIAFKAISDVFLDHIELFTDEEIHEIVQKLLENVTDDYLNNYRDYEKGVEKRLTFIKNVYKHKNWQCEALLTIKSGSYGIERLCVLVEMRRLFEFSDSVLEELFKSCDIIEELCKGELAKGFAWETIIKFMTEFAAVLIKSDCEKTLQHLSNLTSKLTPHIITKFTKALPTCYNKYRELLPRGITSVDCSFRSWWNGLDHGVVTLALQTGFKDNRIKARDMITSMKLMLRSFPKESLDADQIKKWPDLILNQTNRVVDIYYEDSFSIGLHFLTAEEVITLLEGSYGSMANAYKNACFDRLFGESSLQSLGRAELLNDVVKWCLLKNTEERCDDVLALVNKLWPLYETQASIEQKTCLLVDVKRFPRHLDATSAPMSWAIAKVVEGGSSEMIRLVGVFPPGPGFSEVYQKFSWLLPTQLSEVTGETGAVLRALLDAAVDGDSALLEILASLCSDCEAKGWWDEAIDSCVASLALKSDRAICELLYTRAWKDASTGVCERLLVPLLRYSTTPFCEEFLSGVLQDLLRVLRVEATPADDYVYNKRVSDYARALMIVQVAFEKLPESLESPNTTLYRSLKVEKTWYLVREICKLCVTLQERVTYPVKVEKWKKIVRKFHQVAYSCLCSAICCRRPAEDHYNVIFNEKIWSSIVDQGYQYQIPLRASTAGRKVRNVVGAAVADRSDVSSRTEGSSVRTKVFLRTLSESPLQYDLIPIESQTVMFRDVELPDNELNAHPCVPTLTALFEHALTLDHRTWLQTLASTLAGQAPRNVKWLLAQIICNKMEALAPHASVLREPLFQVVASTTEGSRRLLNGLHIDILDTLATWRDAVTLSKPTSLNSTVDCLISTIIDNARNAKPHDILLRCLNDVLLVYGNSVTFNWTSLQKYFEARPVQEIKCCINVASIISKNDDLTLVTYDSISAILTRRLREEYWFQNAKRLGLLGKVAAVASRGPCLGNFRAVLYDIRRRDPAEYVRMLYHAQTEGRECCDSNNFKRVTDLVWKVPRAERSKCLRILTSYVCHHASTDGAVPGMFEVVKLPELIDGDHAEEAIELVRNGLGVMREDLKRGLVKQVAERTRDSRVKVRKAALDVMLAVVKEIYPTELDTHKRRKLDSTPIIDSISIADGYIDIVMTSLALGITRHARDDKDDAVEKEIEQLLNTNSMAMRFVECFVLTAYLPSVRSSGYIDLDLRSSVSVLMEMLFARMRSQEIFKNIKLKDEPLDVRDGNSDQPELLTMSSTYQGTVGSYWSGQNGQDRMNSDPKTSGMDVHVSIDTILETILKFTKTNTKASLSFCVETVKAIRANSGPGFDFDSVMSKLLTEMHQKTDGLTPLALELSRIFMDSLSRVDGSQTSFSTALMSASSQ